MESIQIKLEQIWLVQTHTHKNLWGLEHKQKSETRSAEHLSKMD